MAVAEQTVTSYGQERTLLVAPWWIVAMLVLSAMAMAYYYAERVAAVNLELNYAENNAEAWLTAIFTAFIGIGVAFFVTGMTISGLIARGKRSLELIIGFVCCSVGVVAAITTLGDVWDYKSMLTDPNLAVHSKQNRDLAAERTQQDMTLRQAMIDERVAATKKMGSSDLTPEQQAAIQARTDKLQGDIGGLDKEKQKFDKDLLDPQSGINATRTKHIEALNTIVGGDAKSNVLKEKAQNRQLLWMLIHIMAEMLSGFFFRNWLLRTFYGY